MNLFMQIKFLTFDFQLSEETIERCFFVFRFSVVGNSVKAGFEKPFVAVVVGVQATKSRVLFKDEYIRNKSGKTQSGGKPRKTAADNKKWDMHRLSVFK